MDQHTYSAEQPTVLRAIICPAHCRNVFIAPAKDSKQLDRVIRTRIMYVKKGLKAINEPVLIHDFNVQSLFVVKYKRNPTFSVLTTHVQVFSSLLLGREIARPSA